MPGQASLENLVGRSSAMQRLRAELEQAARYDAPVVLQGESGTGKELAARALHDLGPRAHRPFVAFNCASVVDALFESELFGHEAGAFTGASTAEAGLFRTADGGTLFLDEVGDMSLGHQAKVLRVLETMSVRPVGATRQHRVDVRVVAATHWDLRHAVAAGRFRMDLYFRLNGLQVQLPPLRDRGDDIQLLADHFLAQVTQRYGLDVHGFAPCAVAALADNPWPGNARELRRAVERAAMMTREPVIRADDLGAGSTPLYRPRSDQHGSAGPAPAPRSVGSSALALAPAQAAPSQTLAAAEARHVARVLETAAGNRTRAAKVLGVSRRTLYRLLDRHGLA